MKKYIIMIPSLLSIMLLTINISNAKYVTNIKGDIGINEFLGTFYDETDIIIEGFHGGAGEDGFANGTSGDNIGAVYDNDTTFSQDTSKRWTNWSSDSFGRGEAVTLAFRWENTIYIDQIMMHFFIDAGGCDFPENIIFSYYDESLGSYVEINSSNYVETRNYTDAYRGSDSVYQIKFEGNSNYVGFYYDYTGICPCHTYTLKENIKTKIFKITLDALSGYFVGLTELQFYNDGVLLDIA